MSGVTILTGQAESEHAAKSDLLVKLKGYLVKDDWRPQGGVTHAILPPSSTDSNPIHYFSVLLVKE